MSTALTVILITLYLPAKTYAATDGCPETWKIPELTFQMSGSDFQNFFPELTNKLLKMEPQNFLLTILIGKNLILEFFQFRIQISRKKTGHIFSIIR
jgi:hypothetical protein